MRPETRDAVSRARMVHPFHPTGSTGCRGHNQATETLSAPSPRARCRPCSWVCGLGGGWREREEKDPHKHLHHHLHHHHPPHLQQDLPLHLHQEAHDLRRLHHLLAFSCHVAPLHVRPLALAAGFDVNRCPAPRGTCGAPRTCGASTCGASRVPRPASTTRLRRVPRLRRGTRAASRGTRSRVPRGPASHAVPRPAGPRPAGREPAEGRRLLPKAAGAGEVRRDEDRTPRTEGSAKLVWT